YFVANSGRQLSACRNSLITPLLLIMSMCLVVGCGSNYSELNKYVTEVKARKPGAIEPAPVFHPAPQFVYPVNQLRDPFLPVKRQLANKDDIRPDLNRKKEPLEAFSLDALRMVGTLRQGKAIWAMVTTP